MDIGVESLRLRHMPMDWVSHLVRAGSRIVTKLYKHMVPLKAFQSARIVLGLKVSYNATVIDGGWIDNFTHIFYRECSSGPGLNNPRTILQLQCNSEGFHYVAFNFYRLDT